MPELINEPQTLILWAVIGYLLGSIPSGIILARLMNLGDLRKIGSGNIGATNVLRTGNKKAAAITLISDAAKGAIAVLLAKTIAGEDAAQIAAFAALVGHCFPVWLKFRGGKGVATYLGALGALVWPMGLAACGIWLVTAAISRYSSLAALVAAGYIPILMVFANFGDKFFIAIILAILMYLRHWGNIARLRKGTESKIGAKPAPISETS